MSREIKFRAWDKKRQCWYAWNNVRQTSLDEFLDDDDWVLTQYTGLKDKNGKEIYEGDVVAVKTPETRTTTGEKRMTIDNALSCYAELRDAIIDPFMDNTVEVIGNIYENPELKP